MLPNIMIMGGKMKQYTNPDKWKLIRISESEYKIFATWGGSYTGGSSWKLSSGGVLANVEETTFAYLFDQYSGSTYCLHKGGEGVAGGWDGLLNRFKTQCEEAGQTFEIIENAEIVLLNGFC